MLPGVERESQNDEENEYTGYKWGVFLRAPEIFFKLLRRGGERFIPLGQIAEVKRGITSGCDAFFYPFDVTDNAVASDLSDYEFKENYGISRSDTNKIRIVLAGEKERHLVEAKYLEPELHSVMGLDSVEIRLDQLNRRVLLVSEPKERLKGTEVLKYIKWGERKGFNHGSTVSARDANSSGKQWYDITTNRRGDVIWCKAHQYRHIAWLNAHKLIVNCRMYDIFGT